MLDGLVLDSRFGLRMLLKHRGLTLIGAFAMAVAIAVGATLFEVFSEILDPALPFAGGDRAVSVQFVGSSAGTPERQVLHDFAAMQGRLATVEHLGAYRDADHNLVAAGTVPEPVKVAEISPSAFALTGVSPAQGRYLIEGDDSPSAEPVVVIGHRTWQARFAADPGILGRTINLGGVPRAIVGVMPEGFQFPMDHEFWIPLRVDPLKYPRWEGPRIFLFGRLAPGITLEQAQAEVAAAAQQTAVVHPESGRTLRTTVIPYAYDRSGLTEPGFALMLRAGQLLVGALAMVVAINLAILVYARTVSRLGELAVRSALGASRQRILAQLFVEALALAVVSAVAGLALARYGLVRIQELSHTNGGMPFWVNFDLSAVTVLYAVGLAFLGAVIIGVLPGLKATGKRINANLHELHGRSGTKLGATWTALVIAQVAVAVAVLPVSVFITERVMRMEIAGAGFPAESFVVGDVELDRDATTPEADTITARQTDLIAKLTAEPGVAGVAFSSGIPGFAGSDEIRFEEGVRRRQFTEHVADVGITDALMPSVVRASVNLFETYGATILAGRNFTNADIGPPNLVIVNRSFADMYLQDANAVGVRFRYVRDEANPAADSWFQIIGVVRDFPAFPPNLTRSGEPTIYHPAGAGNIDPVTVSVRLAGPVTPEFIKRFRAIGAEVDPAMQLRRVVRLSDHYDEGRSAWRSMASAVALVTASVLLLSAAGIYALMSFTVAQRTREIGIHTALGARPRRVLLNVFSRAMWQISAGMLAGSLLSAAAFVAIGLDLSSAAPLLLTVGAIMAFVGLLAASGPARRALRIQAIEALRADG